MTVGVNGSAKAFDGDLIAHSFINLKKAPGSVAGRLMLHWPSASGISSQTGLVKFAAF